MKKLFTLILMSFVALQVFAAGTAKVVFRVDMQPAIDKKIFIPGTSTLDVAGTMNNWGGKTMLSRVGTSSIYTFHLDTLTPGVELQFKFRIDGSWDDATAEFPNSGPARKYIVADKQFYHAIYNDPTVFVNTDSVLKAERTSVSFFVDMSPSIKSKKFVHGVSTLDIAGTMNNWNGGPLLKRVDTTSVYTIKLDSLLVGAEIEFKFRINGTWADSTAEFPGFLPARKYLVKKDGVYTGVYNFQNVTTGIAAADLTENALSVFPNPASQEFSFAYNLATSSEVNFTLYNLQGAEVKHISVVNNAGGYKETIDLNGVENGLYFYLVNINGISHKSGKLQVIK